MKTIKIIGAILIAVLALALFAGAGAAVTAGETIFVYENSSNLDPGTYYLYVAGQSTTTTVTAVVANATAHTYAIKGEGLTEGLYKNAAALSPFVLAYPTASVSIVLNKSTSSSVIGGTVPPDRTIDISTTCANANFVFGTDYGLIFTTPFGGHTTLFGKNATSSLPIDWLAGTDGYVEGDSTNVSISAETAGLWRVQALFANDKNLTSDAPSKYHNGKIYAFTIASVTQSINVDKDTIIKGNSFLVTLNGIPGDVVILSSATGLTVLPKQVHVIGTSLSTSPFYKVTIGDGGKTVVQIEGTKDDSYTLTAMFGAVKKTVKVTVQKGEITLVAGQDAYYIGNEITLSGTNTESSKTFLYVKGPNKELQYIGTSLADSTVTVDSDNTWEKKFSLEKGGFDAGTYTFYASTEAFTDAPLSTMDKTYATVAVALRQPFLTATVASSIVARGDAIKITGTAEAATTLQYYVFGTNYFGEGRISPADDATYSKEVPTKDLDAGQCFVVIQHPMYDGVFNVAPFAQTIVAGVTTNYAIVYNSQGVAAVTGINPVAVAGGNTILFYTLDRQSANAAEALCQALDSQNIDDIYIKLTFIVAQPTLNMNFVSDVTKGSALKVSGTTNLKVGSVVTVDVLSTAFTAIEKTSVNSASFISLTTKVVKGTDGVNTWEVTFDTTGLNVDTYTIQAITDDLSTSTVIIIHEKGYIVTPTPTPTPTPPFPVMMAPGFTLQTVTVTPVYSPSVTEEAPVSVSAILTIARHAISSSGSLKLTTAFRTSTLWTVDVYKGIYINNQPSEDGLITSFSSSSFAYTISGFVLDYDQPITLVINLIGKLPPSISGDINAIKIDFDGGSSGLLGSYSYLYGPARPPVTPADEITLRSGWNFISVPKTLNQTANTAGSLFGSVDTDDKNILGYDPIRKTWVPLHAADIIQPLNGYWIYAATGTTISFTYPSAPTSPSVKTLSPGWNAVGLSAGESTSAKTALTGTSWRTLIPWNLAGAKYDAAIVNGGSDANSPNRFMTLGNGYWLYVDAQSTLVGLTA